MKGLLCPHWSADILFPKRAGVWMRLDPGLGLGYAQATSGRRTQSLLLSGVKLSIAASLCGLDKSSSFFQSSHWHKDANVFLNPSR